MTYSSTKTRFSLILLCLLPYFILAQQPELIVDQKGHIERITRMDLSPDHRLLVSIGIDQQIILWNYQTTQLLRRIQHSVPVEEVWFRDKQTFAVLDQKGQVHIWHVNSGQSVKTLGVATEDMLDYAIGKEKQLLAVRKKTGKLVVWNLDTGSKIWEVDGPREKGILHFNKNSQSIFVRTERGKVIANFKAADGSMANENNFFNLSVQPPDEYGIRSLGQGKMIYQTRDEVQVVDFSRELTNTFNNLDQAQTAGLKFPEEGMLRGVQPMGDFAYSSDGNELFLARLGTAMWSTGITQRAASYTISRWNLQTGVSSGMPNENYFAEFMHLASDGEFLITADYSHSFHFRKVTNLETISRQFTQPEVFHTRTIISEDISQIRMHKFDLDKVRTLDLENRGPWSMGEKKSSLSKGKQAYLKKFSAYNINSAVAAYTEPIILMNLRYPPFGALVGRPQRIP
ncbi:MAG: hypothetical protein HRU41_07950 [Saprospiraceae bacterium]|nr:hypothetical protein [Saprospiraceae bacterium]